MSTIKLLEQQAFWNLSESIFLPSRVSVITDKDTVEDIEKHHPKLDEILKYLLRMYGGIWNHYVPISEFQIAQNALVAKDYVEGILERLHQHHIIDYVKAKDKPQLFFLHDRVSENELTIDTRMISILKKRYEERVAFMVSFTKNESECRAKKLISYFGEKIEKNCGQCDICIEEKKKFKSTDFDNIKNTILHEIALHGSINVANFCKQYATSSQETIVLIIRHLVDEKKLKLNDIGDLIKAS
jgi:ATP-dependent DNA helicase RecQ